MQLPSCAVPYVIRQNLWSIDAPFVFHFLDADLPPICYIVKQGVVEDFNYCPRQVTGNKLYKMHT